MRNLTPLLIFLILCSCNPNNTLTAPTQQEAYVPVYALQVDLTQITFESAKTTESAGKIYAIGNYLFQSDINKGIHIIDTRNKNQVRKLGFLKIPFSTEIAVKGNYLYTNNLNDLVVFDISNISSPQLVKRVENVFPVVNQKYPSFSGVMFECPDPKKGIVVRWEKRMLADAKCRR